MLIKKANQKGFTLIELLVVVAIIGLLSSVVLTSISSARAKSRDAQRINDFRQLKTALAFYYDKYGRYPNETPVTNGSDHWWGNFNSMAQQLVNEGFIAKIPVNPSGGQYSYYNYGGTTIGGLLVTSLEMVPNTTTGIAPSCRPFTVNNWCMSTSNDKQYCMCNPY